MQLSPQFIQLVAFVATLNYLLVIIGDAAPTETVANKMEAAVESKPLAAILPTASSPTAAQKLKRDSRAKVTSLELDTQETGYLPTGYQSTDSDYGYDSGKNTYGKQASDWSLYDQGRLPDKSATNICGAPYFGT